jgi:hypothetical protein
LGLSLVNGSRFQPPKRSRSVISELSMPESHRYFVTYMSSLVSL